MKQDVGLYTCGARNELSGRGERVEGVVYLSIEQGGRFVNNLSLDVMMIVVYLSIEQGGGSVNNLSLDVIMIVGRFVNNLS